jgi:hypothetical protein
MSVDAERGRDVETREPVSWTIGGLLAAFAIALGLISLVWYPGRTGTGAMFLALLAAAMGGPHGRLAGIAVAVATVCWLIGMVIAVVTERPIF